MPPGPSSCLPAPRTWFPSPALRISFLHVAANGPQMGLPQPTELQAQTPQGSNSSVRSLPAPCSIGGQRGTRNCPWKGEGLAGKPREVCSLPPSLGDRLFRHLGATRLMFVTWEAFPVQGWASSNQTLEPFGQHQAVRDAAVLGPPGSRDQGRSGSFSVDPDAGRALGGPEGHSCPSGWLSLNQPDWSPYSLVWTGNVLS